MIPFCILHSEFCISLFGGAFYSMSFVKYRLKEVAADFGVTPKEISEIIGKF